MKLFKFGEIVIFIGIQILQGTYCHIFHNIVWGKACWIFRDFRLEVSFYGKGQPLLAKPTLNMLLGETGRSPAC